MIVVVGGVAGSGKTTVGRMLAARLEVAFLDADELHAPESVRRMAAGEPLGDAEREAWIGRVAEAARARDPVVIACSALRRAHRDRLRAAGEVRVFLLDAPREVLAQRLGGRTGHFFGAELLGDQLETLERPARGEAVVVVDAALPAPQVVDAIAAELGPDLG